MSVLVTGAAGFIGSHLVDRLLARGESVVGMDSFDSFYPRGIKEANLLAAREHRSFTLVEGDIRDAGLLATLPESIDAVVHLAARAGVRPSIEAPTLYADVNFTGTSVLLDFAVTRGIRPFVFASSSSVYGNNRTVPFSEEDPVDHPISPYAATKKGAELLCHAAAHLHGLSCMALRFFTVYGPRQRPDLAIRKFSRLLLAGEEIPRFGNGSTARDYTWIDDILDGVEGAIAWARAASQSLHSAEMANEEGRGGGRSDDGRRGAFEIVNLGEATPIALTTMIALLEGAFGRQARIRPLPMQPGDVERTFADIGKAEWMLGYAPATAFEEGVRRFAEWYLAEGAAQDRVPGFA